MDEDEEAVAKIRELNDEFRRSLNRKLGIVVMTRGVADLSDLYRIAAVQKVRLFEDFNEANDPHGEHDFGSFLVGEEKLYFKIDYYDRDYSLGSDDPTDLSRTKRMLTVMLADEY